MAQVLFIAGCSRSGSTALEQALVVHSGGLGIGEVRHFWGRGLEKKEKCACGEVVSNCDFWTQVLAHHPELNDAENTREFEISRKYWESLRGLAGRALPFMRTKNWKQHRDRLLQGLRQLIDSAEHCSGMSVIIDSSKRPCHWSLLKRAAHDHLSAVHIIRDPRAVVHSWGKKKLRPEASEGDKFMARRGLLVSSLAWMAYNTYFALFSRRFKRHVIRYEDLCVDPDRLLDSVGLEDTGFQPLFHSVSGNPSRFSDKPFKLRLDRKWESEMPRWKFALVSALTLPYLLAYNYPVFRKSA